jgi:uncharacterized membrane protein
MNQQSYSVPDQHDREDARTMADVLKDIGSEIRQLVRSEIALARMELGETAQRARSAGLALGAGGLFAVFALQFVLLAAMFGLAVVLPLWISALIISVLSLIIGWAGLTSGRRRLKLIRPPRDTVQTVQEDLKWIKEEPRS